MSNTRSNNSFPSLGDKSIRYFGGAPWDTFVDFETLFNSARSHEITQSEQAEFEATLKRIKSECAAAGGGADGTVITSPGADGTPQNVTNCVAFMQARVAVAHALLDGTGAVRFHCPDLVTIDGGGRRRWLFATQSDPDGSNDKLIFGMQCYEYPNSSSAIEENRGRVCIGLLGATAAYKRVGGDGHGLAYDILNAYFEWCSAVGFQFVHIWACPPQDKLDESGNVVIAAQNYVFPDARIGYDRPEKLCRWYLKLAQIYKWPVKLFAPQHDEPCPDFPHCVKPSIDRHREYLLSISLACHFEHEQYVDVSPSAATMPDGGLRGVGTAAPLDFSDDANNITSTKSILALWNHAGVVLVPPDTLKVDANADMFNLIYRERKFQGAPLTGYKLYDTVPHHGILARMLLRHEIVNFAAGGAPMELLSAVDEYIERGTQLLAANSGRARALSAFVDDAADAAVKTALVKAIHDEDQARQADHGAKLAMENAIAGARLGEVGDQAEFD